ncbi:hypothetical protein [Naasia sp. SYSU D00057]|uniref:hypothetical protein n=1 Tax=Naasia sp. SYSU D00057 TaxID=2817380 RepID=UPI001B308FC4|nr:hypothetical protein [Naasia sp. SYSU D00057]
MKVISYAEEHIVTTDEIAGEVLSYARDLGRSHLADTVDVPALYEDGHVGEVQLLIGPASQLTVLETDNRTADIPAEEFLADIRRRSAAIRSPLVARVGEAGIEDYDPDEPTDGS